MPTKPESVRRAREEWERNELRQFLERQPEAKERYETLSGLGRGFGLAAVRGLGAGGPRAGGEGGREGVAVCALDDMEALFEGIDLTQISVSMTINPTAWILLAMYVALAQSRGYDLSSLS